MQIQDQKRVSKKLKKSQVILVGSLLVLFGCFVITGEYSGNPAFNIPLVLNENDEIITESDEIEEKVEIKEPVIIGLNIFPSLKALALIQTVVSKLIGLE